MTATAHQPADGPIIDYRFTLANERTLLSWIRTALALIAAGVAVHELVPQEQLTGLHVAIAAGCMALAMISALGGYIRWRRVDRAMDAGGPLPRNHLVAITVAGIAGLTGLASVGLLIW